MRKVVLVLSTFCIMLCASCGIDSDALNALINTQPFFKSTAPATATELVTYNYDIVAGDSDSPAQALTITLNAQDTCDGVFVDNGNRTGSYVFAPPQRTSGRTCVVGLTVTDSKGASKKQNTAVAIGSRSIPSAMIPPVGKATAMYVDDPQMGMWGPDALGGKGDYIIMNNQAAFMVEGLEKINSYIYYGGILIDAVALNGVDQTGPEQFEELVYAVGQLSPEIFLRLLRGENIQIMNDGSIPGDSAWIRVYCSDDVFWLIELELISTMEAGRSSQLGMTFYVDYILKPDSSVLEITVTLYNSSTVTKTAIAGAAGFFGDTTRLKYPYMSSLVAAGISADMEVGWLSSTSINGDGAYGIGLLNGNLGSVSISGVQAILDANVFSSPFSIASLGSAQLTYYFSVGDSDAHSALAPLFDYNPTPIVTPTDTMTFVLQNISGTAKDSVTGSPIPNAVVEVQHRVVGNPTWKFLDSYITDTTGNFNATVPELSYAGNTFEYQVTGYAEGYQNAAPIVLDPAAATGLDVPFDPQGQLAYDVKDENGMNIPVKLMMFNQGDGNRVQRIFSATGVGSDFVMPGDYNVSVSRGLEYTTDWIPVTIVSGETVTINSVLTRTVNTDGFMSFDSHMHASPSADNIISVTDRIISSADEGLDIAISTDHEYLGSWRNGIIDSGLEPWINTVTGQEVTAGMPGHSQIYPAQPRFQDDARGGIIQWWEPNGDTRAYYSMDPGQIFAADRARGAGVVQINHPRDSGMANYSLYNPMTGTSDQNPLAIGLAPFATLLRWDLDFDAYEIMNGFDDVFYNGSAIDPTKTGPFEDWISFINRGHRVTVVGVSDVHNYLPHDGPGVSEDPGGWPRNYFESSTDDPLAFNQDEFVNAMLEGRVLVSLGAFARVEANGAAGMGDTVTDTDGTVQLYVHIEALTNIDVTFFKVFVNGDEVATIDIPLADQGALVKYDGTIDVTIPLTADANIVVAGFGANLLPKGMPQFLAPRVARFITNAIYVDTDNSGAYDDYPGYDGCTYTF